MNIGHNIVPIYNDRFLSWRSQRYVKDGPILGTVDLFTAEHRFDARSQTGLFGQLTEQSQRFIRNSILRVIEIDPSRFGGHTLATFRVSSKKGAKMLFTNLLGVILEFFPCRTLVEQTRDDRPYFFCHSVLLIPILTTLL
jgi:hypothetical protein